ncbi:MAG: hypothetical protein B7X65_16120 [Polaromonas sp. 39-63-25]|jgi:hypothetical protein|nr:MAG: hypothetical protein B7X65_16120 [Polaromonas sp. 39-63-25]
MCCLAGTGDAYVALPSFSIVALAPVWADSDAIVLRARSEWQAALVVLLHAAGAAMKRLQPILPPDAAYFCNLITGRGQK